jgi:hypothetical protein
MAGSRWRIQLSKLRAGLPRSGTGRQIEGIIEIIVGTGEGGLNRIGALHYRACPGHPHPLDGQSIDFGDHGIARSDVPSPWRELLGDVSAPFSFELDRPVQELEPGAGPPNRPRLL